MTRHSTRPPERPTPQHAGDAAPAVFIGMLQDAGLALDEVAGILDAARGEAAVDLGTHDLAVGSGVVVAAKQGAGEVGPGLLGPTTWPVLIELSCIP